MFVEKKKISGGGFGKKFESGHLVGTENTRFAVCCELFKELPAESGFAGGGSRADDVKTRAEELKLVDIDKAGFAIGVIFEVSNFAFKMVCKIIR